MRPGNANLSAFFAYHDFDFALVGFYAAATSSARNCIFCAIRRLTMVSSLSSPIATASR